MAYNPGTSFRVTSQFGSRWGKPHAGVDFAAVSGTPVPAASSGTVWYSGLNQNFYGNTVVIRHIDSNGQPYFTLYAHLDGQNMPAVGATIATGQTIGRVGTTSGVAGVYYGAHLHFEVITGNAPINNAAGGPLGISGSTYRVDPATFTNWGAGGVFGGTQPLGSPATGPATVVSSDGSGASVAEIVVAGTQVTQYVYENGSILTASVYDSSTGLLDVTRYANNIAVELNRYTVSGGLYETRLFNGGAYAYEVRTYNGGVITGKFKYDSSSGALTQSQWYNGGAYPYQANTYSNGALAAIYLYNTSTGALQRWEIYNGTPYAAQITLYANGQATEVWKYNTTSGAATSVSYFNGGSYAYRTDTFLSGGSIATAYFNTTNGQVSYTDSWRPGHPYIYARSVWHSNGRISSVDSYNEQTGQRISTERWNSSSQVFPSDIINYNQFGQYIQYRAFDTTNGNVTRLVEYSSGGVVSRDWQRQLDGSYRDVLTGQVGYVGVTFFQMQPPPGVQFANSTPATPPPGVPVIPLSAGEIEAVDGGAAELDSSGDGTSIDAADSELLQARARPVLSSLPSSADLGDVGPQGREALSARSAPRVPGLSAAPETKTPELPYGRSLPFAGLAIDYLPNVLHLATSTGDSTESEISPRVGVPYLHRKHIDEATLALHGSDESLATRRANWSTIEGIAAASPETNSPWSDRSRMDVSEVKVRQINVRRWHSLAHSESTQSVPTVSGSENLKLRVTTLGVAEESLIDATSADENRVRHSRVRTA